MSEIPKQYLKGKIYVGVIDAGSDITKTPEYSEDLELTQEILNGRVNGEES